MTAGEALRRRNSPLGMQLRAEPGRCSGCGGHLGTQPHGPHCPFGPRAIFTIDTTGRISSRPTPPPTGKPDTRYGPPDTNDYRGYLPTTCTACGAYPAANGAGHNSRCPAAHRTQKAS